MVDQKTPETPAEVAVGDFKCEQCGRRFGSKLALSIHEGRTHGKAPKGKASKNGPVAEVDAEILRQRLWDMILPEGTEIDYALGRRTMAWIDEGLAIREAAS